MVRKCNITVTTAFMCAVKGQFPVCKAMQMNDRERKMKTGEAKDE